MDKRYQVFISSTFKDLQDERRQAMMALLGMDAIPAGMELFQASDDDQWSYIKDVIDQCDYYVLIVGFRYGSTNSDGVSFTELEYDYAVTSGKPIMSLLRTSENGLSADQIERDPGIIQKLKAFREKVSSDRMCKFYEHPMEVGQHVMAAYMRIKRTHPGRGWIPGDQAAGSEMLQRLEVLRQRVSVLERELELARTTAPIGSESLAQGSDNVDVELAGTSDWEIVEGTWRASWDAVFGAMGTFMLDEASESLLCHQSAGALLRVAKLVAGPQGADWKRVTVRSFEDIKVQLVALGLIKRSEKKRGVRDTATYWSLTDYGRTYLMTLRAVRRES